MAEELQGPACSGSWWWSSGMRWSGGADESLVSCSTSVDGDQSGIFCQTPCPDGNASSFGNSPASSITFQDSQTLQLFDHMASMPAMDASSTPQLPVSDLSPLSVDHRCQLFLVENDEMYPPKDMNHGYFTDPSSSDSTMNNNHHLFSFGSPLLDSFLAADAFPEILKTTQLKSLMSNNTTFDINGSSPFSSSWDTNFMKNTALEEKPKSFVHSTTNSEPVRNSRYTEVLKKPRIETPPPLQTFKVRKEKLGDRITALQQLVSPFGKTDTASVLYEATEYIKFLQEQVKTLSTPYFRNGSQTNQKQNIERENDSRSRKLELRSRGLCLVPISSTFSMACSEFTSMDVWASSLFDLM